MEFMGNAEKKWHNYITFVLIAVVIITVVIRVCVNTTQNVAFGISGKADGSVKMADSRFVELEFDAPTGGLTGFCFHFNGDWKKFEETKFWVQVEIREGELTSQILHKREIALSDQAYDYQNECFKAMIPFEGEVKPGDHLRIAIMGIGMKDEDGITIATSSQMGVAGATFEVNDFVQDGILAGELYYQTKGRSFYSIIMQGIVCILLILLGGEVRKKPAQKGKARSIMPVSDWFYKERILRFIPIIILLILILDYAYYAGFKERLRDTVPADGYIEVEEKDASYIELCDGEAIFTEWWVESDHLGGIGLYLKKQYDGRGSFSVTVSEAESQDVVAEIQTTVPEMVVGEEGNLLKFEFDRPVRKSSGMEYVVSIFYSGKPIELLVPVKGASTPILVPLYQNNLFLMKLFFIFAILITGFTIAVFLCLENRMKVEKLFLTSVISLGLLFEIVITPFAVPDEAAHIDTAYRISNQILGVEDTGIKDAIYKRKCDIFVDSGDNRKISVESYRWLYDGWFGTEPERDGRLTFAADTRANADSLFFLPAAVSMTLGRILGIGFIPMIFWARTANLLLAAWMLYLALKKIPFGKSVLCAIVLLPLTLQEIASCSYDSMIIAVSILYVSYCVFALYSKEKLSRRDILVIAVTAIMLGLCKGEVYTPLYLLVIWILKKRGYIRLPQQRKWRVAGIAVIATACLVGVIGLVIILRQPVDVYSLQNGYYTLSYLIRHPIETLRIAENTLYGSLNVYLTQFIGGGLGYFQINTGFIIPAGYICLVGGAIICDEKRPFIVNTENKCLFLTASLLSIVAIHLGLLLATSFGVGTVWGVQARYFIPVLWLVMISLRCGKVTHKKKLYRKLVWSGYILGVCTVLQIVIDGLRQAGN